MTTPLERLDGAATASLKDGAALLRHEFVESRSILSGGISSLNDDCLQDGQLIFKDPFANPGDPFNRDGFDQCKDFGDKILHGLKKLFGSEETLGDQVKEYVENKQMTPAEREQLKKEEKLFKQEEERYWSQMRLAYMGPLDHHRPDINDPRFATMKKRDDLVKKEEADIKSAVEKEMGPLMKDVKKEMADYEDSYKIKNPLGTGEGFKPHIAGHTLEVYWRKIREETERRATA